MRHSYGLQDLFIQNAWLTIGSYDGVHLGHQQIIHQITAGAHQAGAPAVVLTFFPHPAIVLRGPRDSFYLTLPEEKAELLGEMGVDEVITYPFSRQTSETEPEDFIRMLITHLGFSHLWVGYDFALGKDRKGDVETLISIGEKYGFVVHVIEAYQQDGEVVSSSRVRQAVEAGRIMAANRLLGNRFTIRGKVIPGDGRGSTIGIPTANLAVARERAVPGPGVYVCLATVEGETYPAVTNIGVRPTFEDAPVAPRIETHILDFSGDIYGSEISLAFVDFLRPEQKFSGVDQLVAQIRADIAQGREILTNT
ncbi:MAG: bifunctional riboflavin kinase/FAD synthetase [Anaerolineales bacterium]|nr:bifunctional riboflavin kinase/FAD synthetase [Anaerolineales bacterium]